MNTKRGCLASKINQDSINPTKIRNTNPRDTLALLSGNIICGQLKLPGKKKSLAYLIKGRQLIHPFNLLGLSVGIRVEQRVLRAGTVVVLVKQAANELNHRSSDDLQKNA